MKFSEMSFDGNILARGFWLYVWDIRSSARRCLYVGRTGDSSSANASSPFRRIGQHLDDRPKAKANAIARHLRTAGIEPTKCTFKMIGIGPIFPEQTDFARHKIYRDKVAALEHQLAQHLRGRGLEVLGVHSTPKSSPKGDIADILRIVDAQIQ
ncbi:hypothetical protein EPO17_03765 [Patescibacteria group bacterium]|nr:MAG: hypothetical protein EPO17_03765 [Patescibacteria group bacterium]